jgi:outer membrane protein OmpA-like peptidoglycan-associated protein/opacity protein-like surface antigen
MMRKLAVSLALASTALASPALARDDSWYVGVDAGVQVVEDLKYDVGAVNNGQIIDHKYGADFDGLIGYDFGGFRLEAEVGYKRARVDALRATTTTRAFTAAGVGFNAPAGTYDYAGGSTSALSFMVNGLLDFGDDDGIQGFIGGGVGVARVKADSYALNRNGSFLDDSDTVLAWQGIAGVRAPISDHLDVSLKYRFFNADKVKLVDVTGRALETRYRSHSILGGLTYNFGEPAAPPPPPPPPAPEPVVTPPPPPPPVVCSPGPYIVFFDWDKSDIKPEAASILDEAIGKYQTCGNAQVMLAGHADKSGSATYNVGLSERRNASVQAYLTGHGIPAGVITTQAFGESRPRVETADGVREVQNRRVEITYGPGSGM